MRIALRTLLRAPGFAATAIGTIALAISLAAVVFAVVDGVLFKPLPYPDAERLFVVQGRAEDGTDALAPLDVDYLREADVRVTLASFAGAAALRHAERPEIEFRSFAVDRHFFDVLGQRPLFGGFAADDFQISEAAGAPRAAVVTYTFWRDQLGGDPAAVGRPLNFLDERLFVAGVLPRDFVFPHSFARVRPDILVPLTTSPSAMRWSRSLSAIARFGADISREEGQAKLDAIFEARKGEYPVLPRRSIPGAYVGVELTPLSTVLGRAERPLFRAAFAGAALLILLGCVNVAGLLVARTRDRERELNVRAALGATRTQLLRLLLLESLLIGMAGACAGLLAAQPLLAAALGLLPDQVLLLKPPAIDARVIAFAVAAAVITLTVVSALSLASLLRPALARGLAGAAATTRARSWRRALILGSESAIGITLTIAGSLVVTSFIVLRGSDPGFDRERLVLIDALPANASTPEQRTALNMQVFERLQKASDVQAVTMLGAPLFENAMLGTMFVPPPGSEAADFWVNDIPVFGDFFGVAALQLLDGRVLTATELTGGHHLAVVSERTAARYWPGQRAVGQTLATGNGKIAATVVGVVEEARVASQADDQRGELYIPAALRSSTHGTFLARTGRDPGLAARDLADALRRDVPGVVVRRAESLEMALANSVRLQRFRGVLFGTASAAALLLVAVGIAGIVATGVAQRFRELGIRSAIGASRAGLTRMMVLEHLRPIAAGVACGLLASWWAVRFITAFLYGITPHEPLVWVAATASLLLAGALAAWLPAHRASSVDPAIVLRAE